MMHILFHLLLHRGHLTTISHFMISDFDISAAFLNGQDIDIFSKNSNEIGENGDEDIVKELYRAWRNERGSPELQESPEEMIKELLELIHFQTLKLTQARPQSSSQNNLTGTNFAFLDCLYQMDLERIKFVLKSLLRCRLGKIERSWAEFWPTWSTTPRTQFLQSKLSTYEREYLQAFSGNLMSSLQESILDKLPPESAGLDEEEMLARGSKPIAIVNNDTHVICKVMKDVGEVVLDPISRATAPLQVNDVFVLQYSVIKDFLTSGDVELI